MTKKRQYEPRRLMELAIEVMSQSVPEPRPDGKASPKVGVVLVKPDGMVETACRGELRHGDHAEFTLLERKSRGNKLDGSILEKGRTLVLKTTWRCRKQGLEKYKE